MTTMTSNTLNYHNSKGEVANLRYVDHKTGNVAFWVKGEMNKNGEEKINISTWGEFIKRFNQI